MMAWLDAPALWGLAAALGALLVHLLFRQRATRVPFPSLRFVHPSFTSAVRVRRPTDPGLLALRGAILIVAALALAQPLLVTASRSRSWDGRIARAIVVDASDSMRGARDAAAEAARAQVPGAMASRQFDADQLGRGVREAVAWLATAPPARREIVVISDFQQGALSSTDIGAVPEAIGVRFLPVGALPAARDATGAGLLDEEQVAIQRVRLEGDTTAVDVRRTGGPAAGLEIVGPPGSDAELGALRRTVSAAGTPAPLAAEPIVLVLQGGGLPASVQAVSRAWMRRSLQVMRADDDLRAIGEPAAPDPDGPWSGIVQDRNGRTLVRVAAAGDRFVVDVAADPADLLAAAALRAALLAAPAPGVLREQEVLAIPAATLTAWTREAQPAGRSPESWRRAAPDSRWGWGLALVLLATEAMVRRRDTRRSGVRARAA